MKTAQAEQATLPVAMATVLPFSQPKCVKQILHTVTETPKLPQACQTKAFIFYYNETDRIVTGALEMKINSL